MTSNLSKQQFVDTVGELYKSLKGQYPEVKLGLQPLSTGGVHLDTLIVPKEKQNQGIGSEIMKQITGAADTHGWELSVTPSTDFGATSINRLRKFYRKHGFTGKGTMRRK